jgi:hypothetical protein
MDEEALSNAQFNCTEIYAFLGGGGGVGNPQLSVAAGKIPEKIAFIHSKFKKRQHCLRP